MKSYDAFWHYWNSMKLLTPEQQGKCALLGIIVFVRDHGIYVRLDQEIIRWLKYGKPCFGAAVFKTVDEAIKGATAALAKEEGWEW